MIITKLGIVVATREWIIHCIYATLLNFAPGAFMFLIHFLLRIDFQLLINFIEIKELCIDDVIAICFAVSTSITVCIFIPLSTNSLKAC